jgi:hypothetical protein
MSPWQPVCHSAIYHYSKKYPFVVSFEDWNLDLLLGALVPMGINGEALVPMGINRKFLVPVGVNSEA